jgi:cation diffusion facilitator family transporter
VSEVKPKEARPLLQALVMGISLGMSLIMLAGKSYAWWVSGSAAIMSDAAESVIHGFATGFAAYSLWYSQRPADPTHTYGHGKMAYFSAGFEGALIFSASLVIIGTSVRELILGVELQQLGLGLIITGALCGINLLLGLSLVFVGRKERVLILVSNGQHVLSDMWTSLAVVGGVGVVLVTGLNWLDPVVAILAGANIGWMGIRLMRRSVGGLLDEADPKALATAITLLDGAREAGEIKGYHQLRLRPSDNLIWIEVHMQVPGKMSVTESHARVTAIEERLRREFPGREVHITSHVEPDPHSVAHPEGHPGIHDPFADQILP